MLPYSPKSSAWYRSWKTTGFSGVREPSIIIVSALRISWLVSKISAEL